MKTGNYPVEDLILNESFQKYVLYNESTEYWEEWIKENPQSAYIVESAKEIITFIVTRKALPKYSSISAEVFEKLQKQISDEKLRHTKPLKKISLRYYWVAASILLAVGVVSLSRYYVRSDRNWSAGQYLDIIVPEGQRSQVILPDGTKVWLNSGTVFKYPSNFISSSGRNVYLNGEAFFEVKHNEKRPFYVHLIENLTVKVLGTEFNVKSYSSDKTIETTLVKGSVKIIKGNGKDGENEIGLKPNEKATFQKDRQKFIITHLTKGPANNTITGSAQKLSLPVSPNEIEMITAWKEEALVFDNETFEEIGVKMQRWFGFKIVISDEDLKKERFTGKFVNNESIFQILDIFNRSESIQYSTKDREIKISKRK